MSTPGLAVTTSTRWEGLPDIPTVGEFVPGYDGSGWYGVGAPKARRSKSSIGSTRRYAGLADPKMKVRVAEMGETTLAASPAAVGKLIAGEIETWEKVIRAANIKPE